MWRSRSNQVSKLEGSASDDSSNYRHAVDLDTNISKNGRFRSFVYNRREIRTIADNLGFKTDRVRIELRKLGYSLIKNNNGRRSGEEMDCPYEDEAQDRCLASWPIDFLNKERSYGLEPTFSCRCWYSNRWPQSPTGAKESES